MKKLALLFCLIYASTSSLVACKVNWFDRQFDVKWWVIAIPVVIFSVIVWIVAGKHIAENKYVCPKCSKTFYPKWWKAAFSFHINDERVFKCPHCGIKGFCHIFKETSNK